MAGPVLRGRCIARPRAGLLRSIQRRDGRVAWTEGGLSVLQSTGRLRESAPWIDHYWGNKSRYGAAVHEQLATILVRGMSVEEAIGYVRDHPIREPLRAKPRRWQVYGAQS